MLEFQEEKFMTSLLKKNTIACGALVIFTSGLVWNMPYQALAEMVVLSQGTEIMGETDGVIKNGQPQKVIAGNGQPYEICKGVSVSGEKGNSLWIFTSTENAEPGTIITVQVCGTGNTYMTFIIKVNGAGSYILNTSSYGNLNQGLALESLSVPSKAIGKVLVHYVDEEGIAIADDNLLPIEKWVYGTTPPLYDTTVAPYYQKRIEFKNEIYEVDENKQPYNVKGSYKADQTVEITYIYKKSKVEISSVQNSGGVIIHYVDEQGNTIADDTQLPMVMWEKGEAAPRYDTTIEPYFKYEINYNGEQYYLDRKRLATNVKGEYQDTQTIDVTYFYKKKTLMPTSDRVSGKVVVRYLDNLGRSIAPHIMLPQLSWKKEQVAPSYDTSVSPYYIQRINFQGKMYEIDKENLPSNIISNYKSGQLTEVLYVYKLLNKEKSVEKTLKQTNTLNNFNNTTNKIEKNESKAIAKVEQVKTEHSNTIILTHHEMILPDLNEKRNTLFLSFVGLFMSGVALLMKSRK